MVSSARSFLLATQSADGGWGYAAGQDSMVEATAAVVLALDGAGDAAPRDAAVAWLAAGQHADGGWGVSHGDSLSNWSTAWALLALAQAGGEQTALAAAVKWLLRVPVQRITDDELQQGISRKLSIDASLRGWSWRPGEAPWVEPTSLAMLALQAAPGAPANPEVAKCLDEGLRYLADRRCAAGGWNFGNPYMLGASLPARAHPTAWAMLALTRRDPAVVQPEDVQVLRRDMQADGGMLALTWGLLALRARGLDDAEAAGRLARLQGDDGAWHANPYYTALAVLVTERRAFL